MPERDELDEQLRRELLRQTPHFELWSSLPNKVSVLVRRRQRVRVILAVAAAAAVVVAVAIPLSALRSEPLSHRITPATTPVPTTPAVALPPLACGALDLWTNPDGTPVTTTATLGRVTVSLSGTTVAVPGGDPSLLRPELSIVVRNGGRFSVTVAPPARTNSVIPWPIAPRPAGTTPRQNSDALCLVNSPGVTMPMILLGLDTGGAHCCTVIRAIALFPSGPAPAVDHDLGNPGASLGADGDYAIIVTADNAFAYAFSSYALSGMPLEVVQVRRGTFVDITRDRPDLLTRDASTWWTEFNSNPGFGLGVLAAWVADQCNLGQGAAAWTTVDQLQAQGRLSGPAGWPQGAAYVQALKVFLARHGYCPS